MHLLHLFIEPMNRSIAKKLPSPFFSKMQFYRVKRFEKIISALATRLSFITSEVFEEKHDLSLKIKEVFTPSKQA